MDRDLLVAIRLRSLARRGRALAARSARLESGAPRLPMEALERLRADAAGLDRHSNALRRYSAQLIALALRLRAADR